MTETKKEYTFIVLDFETTGLDLRDGHIILECAAIHVDFKTLQVLGAFQQVVHQKTTPLPIGNTIPIQQIMDPYVLNMHTENGLIAEILDPLKSIESRLKQLEAFGERENLYYGGETQPFETASARDLDKHLSRWLRRISIKNTEVFERKEGLPTSVEHNKIRLCGNSIHFDRKFLEHHLPEASTLLDHRQVDVSSLIVAYENWVEEMPPPERAHRALADCEMSLKALRFMRDVFMNSKPYARDFRESDIVSTFTVEDILAGRG